MQGVSFANPPGFSRPQMATLEQLDLKLALIPLLSHRVEIDRLVLVKPDIMLETDAQGRPNWQFTPARPAERPQSGGAGGQRRGADPHQRAPMCGSRTAPSRWRDGAHRPQVPCSDLKQPAGQRAVARCQPASVTGDANYNGAPFTLAGEFGPLTRLQDRQSDSAWPVQTDHGR